MPWFCINRHKLKTTECEHQYETRKLCPMLVLCLCVYWCDCWCCFMLDTCSTHIDITENLNAYQTFLSRAKAIPIQEAQKLHCVDAAASDAENLCRWCLASPVDIFLRIFVPISLKRLCKTCTIYNTRFIKSFNRRKRFLYSGHRNLLQIGNVDQELSLLVNKLTILRYSFPQVWIDNSCQANPGNSCSHAHFLSVRRTKTQDCRGGTLHCRDLIRDLPTKFVTMRCT